MNPQTPAGKPGEPGSSGPDPATDIATVKEGVTPLPAADVDEKLLPFGKAAKAIFVKANGLPAYYRSTGSFRLVRT